MLIDDYWLLEFRKYRKITVGLSGGLDSSVLLHSLASISEFKVKLQAIHINHGFSPNADLWQEHCKNFCAKLNVQLFCKNIEIKTKANLEEAARDARYAIFNNIINNAECIALGHHQHDLVETLLFNLFRGTGIDGLASIPKRRKCGLGEIVRPFLNLTRDVLHNYAKLNNLDWIEDESNINLDFSRNYIRHSILPIITAKWPNALHNIHDCAQNCTAAKKNLADLALLDAPNIFVKPLQLELNFIKSLPYGRIINVLRCWFKHNNVTSPSGVILGHIVKQVIFAKHDKVPRLMIGNFALTRYQNCLYLRPLQSDSLNLLSKDFFKNSSLDILWENFPNPLKLDDGRIIKAEISPKGIPIPKNAILKIRFRVGGEVIKHNRQHKKLKKIFQEFKVLPWERNILPLLYVNNELQAVIGLLQADCDLDSKTLLYEIDFF